MTDEWIVRVQGKEYGPVEVDTLREWKMEGRLLPANEARRTDLQRWTTAADISDLSQRVSSILRTCAAHRGPFPVCAIDQFQVRRVAQYGS